MSAEEQFSQLVVVGSSAGGIEALSNLVASLPSDFPAPLVIAQHLDPNRMSRLGEILTRHSTLPVRTVVDHEPLQPGTVYVVPANRNVEISDHDVQLRDGFEAAGLHKPSIDLLLVSASRVFGEGLIAVILTGTGSDGAAGAHVVKTAGGTVIIQNPRTASFPALPLSLAPTTVDIVADLDDLGPLLHDLLIGVYRPMPGDDAQVLPQIIEQLRQRRGIDFQHYKQPTIMRRLQRRVIATGQGTLAEYLRYLQHHPEEYIQLVGSFLISVTEFFRDPELFSYLRENILPDLIEEARSRGNELRLWSAGCATGEEPYSLAMLVADALGPELGEFHVRIFATDLDAEAIDFARRGVYPAAALVNLPRELIQRHFTEIDGEFHVNKPVRNLVVFGQHDLTVQAPFPRIDVMMCRNVLIYFTPELQRHVLQVFAYSLRDGGYLLLGKSETVSPLGEFFVSESPNYRIHRRRGDRSILPPARLRDAVPTGQSSHRLLSESSTFAGVQAARFQRDIPRRPSQRERLESLLLHLPYGIVIVDQRYDIQMINAAARDLLAIHSSAIGEDFVHLAGGLPPRELRAMIDSAFRGDGRSELREIWVEDGVPDGGRWISLSAERNRVADQPDDTVTVIITDVTDVVGKQRELEDGIRAGEEARAQAVAQVEKLTQSNSELHSANQELAATNRELRSVNEEFVVGNEELQAAAEEVETLNEELQATNEELETLNEELQATVEELNTTNDDLQARSVELQELAVSLESERRASDSERARLSAILLGMRDAVMVVDQRGEVILSNPAYEQMFGSADAPLQLSLPDGTSIPEEERPRKRAAAGDSFSQEFVATRADGGTGYFEAVGQPLYPDGTDHPPEGGLIVVRDITDRSLRRLQDRFLQDASHELRTPLTVLTGYLDMIGRLPAGDERAGRYVRLARDQAGRMDRLLHDLLDVARLQSGRLILQHEPVELIPLVQNTIEALRMLPGGDKIRLETSGDGIVVDGDPTRLEQVLVNLVNNATVHAADSEHVDVRVRQDGESAEIQVQDGGPGIPEDLQPHLFDRFARAERPDRAGETGLGLGLFITHEIVTQLGGTISVESEVGKGTTMTVRVPVAGDER